MDSLPVFALELGTLFGGFGLRLLVRYGFLDAKAGFGGFGSEPWVRLGIPGAKAANETGGLCPYSALLNWDTFCLRLDFYGAGFDIGFKIIDKVLKVFGFLPSVPVSY